MKTKCIAIPIIAAVFTAAAILAGVLAVSDNRTALVITASALGAAALVTDIVCAALWLHDARERVVLEREHALRAVEHEKALTQLRSELQQQFSEDIVRFHSRVTHAMRIPISIVMGYADLLRGGLIADDEARQQYIDRICDRVSYMNDLLGQLMLEARTTAGVPAMMLQPLDILALVRGVADETGSMALKKGVVLRVNSSDEKAVIMGDVMHLTKIFYNIIENALKYMGREGTVNITASCAGGSVLIVFKDDGKGLSPQEADRVFEQSFQGSNRGSGHGLGLYLVREIVTAHGGSVSAKSDIDRGMAIYITLPLLEQQTQTQCDASLTHAG